MIRKLPQDVVNQIAAGEVVERPASVVKELVENALDAGADHIVIRVLDGGRQEIVVEDNGSGIEYDDIPRVFEPHATSKIQRIEDLDQLLSMGFRGEALASISSVARVTLETRPKTVEVGGYQYTQEGQKSSEIVKIAKSVSGTKISIQNLFFNVPARKKFLKTKGTELSHIVRVVENVALANPDKHIELYSEGRRLYSYPVEDLRDRIVRVLGLDSPEYLLPVTHLGSEIQVTGYVGHPRLSRKSQAQTRLFVNGRPITHSAVARAVQSGFDTMLEVGHYPVYTLFLQVSPNLVDVNVHPRKSEVKFHDERAIFSQVRTAVREALTQDAFSVVLTPEEPRMRKTPFQKQPAQVVSETSSSYRPERPTTRPDNPFAKLTPTPSVPRQTSLRDLLTPSQEKYDSDQPGIEQQSSDSELQLGQFVQVFDTYILYKNEQGIMVFDQHAVHEKVLLEQFMNEPERIVSHQLLLPITLSVVESEKSFVLDTLAEVPGIEIEEFGVEDVVVRAVPSFLLKFDKLERLLKDIVDIIIEHKDGLHIEDIRTEVYKTVACKAAIKAGKRMTEPEIQALIKDARTTDFGFACCHGRPTMVQLDQDWFEKQFSRK